MQEREGIIVGDKVRRAESRGQAGGLDSDGSRDTSYTRKEGRE